VAPAHEGKGWVALRYSRGDSALFAAFNLSEEPIEATIPSNGKGSPRALIWTGAPRYGGAPGSGPAPRADARGRELTMALGPLSAAAWTQEGSMEFAGRR
jgi:hypothetical protein